MPTNKSVPYRIAYAVRVVSIPPLLVTGLIVILALLRDDVFRSPVEIAVAILSLAVFPVLAYPISFLIPKLKATGRKGQRQLAFILTAVGYLAGFVFGMIAPCAVGLRLLFGAYFISVIILILFNKLLKVRASGHAAGITGPILFVSYFLGLRGLVVGLVLWGIILWASILTKRHTVSDFLLGSAVCVASFGIAWLIWH